MKILIIDDHPWIRNGLIKLLISKWYIAEWVSNGVQWLERLKSHSFDVIILDINMPVMNGKDFIQRLRIQWESIPVLALTSDSLLEDKIEMFELGVDDYLVKPFEFDELYVRLKALSKRKWEIIKNIIEIWDISIDIDASKVFINNIEVIFQNKQYWIIRYLIKNRGYPKNKLEIMEYAWGEKEENLQFNTVALESHIYIIRKRLGKDFIKTVKWIWYLIP
jgi:DNA-binding response OmpR family regulator